MNEEAMAKRLTELEGIIKAVLASNRAGTEQKEVRANWTDL